MSADRELVRRAIDDVAFFARVLAGRELWPHQLEVARSEARYRVICAGRQVGKSALLSVLALHAAFRRPDQLVLIVSAGEAAARRLLEDVAALATSAPMLRGAVADDTTSSVVLSNGSTIRAVPASQRQIRGWAVDLLILDEAGFIDPEIWRAAEPAIIARPGSRVILSSSPWGSVQHFFRVLWQRGMSAPDGQVASWHWPSSISPLVDASLLEEIRSRESPTYFAREYLAEWTEGAGSYFTSAEIEGAIADYELVDPAEAEGQMVVGGVDWGLANDANTLALIGVANDAGLNHTVLPTEPLLFVAHLEEHYRMPYASFIDRVVDVADWRRGRFHVRYLASETNGVGAMPTDVLARRAFERRTGTRVAPVVTDARRKASGFGTIKGLLQQGRLVLPRHPSLLKQLHAVEFEISEAGNIRIAVPERAGHDDLVMALAQAVSCVRPSVGFRPDRPWGTGPVTDDVVETPGGVVIPRRPRCVDFKRAFLSPQGPEKGDGW